ncbi:hypothetical protein Taro_021855 [Colocasia esculenta]|uniref:Retrotransposon gag domain-containing protein n=1 Tax=Colocasia esculenta TaxID=4460 RepID=A0A843V6N4_COLES|nr:hypothetical protein [Colocasia esculenta]
MYIDWKELGTIVKLPRLRQELNGQLAAMKIPGWRHDLVSLTHVDSSYQRGLWNCLANSRLWLRVVGVVFLLVRMSRGERRGLSSRSQHLRALALVPQEYGHGGPSIMERFKRMAPPSFKGESQPLLVESWMREIEKIFRAIRCVEEDKVTLATYMLQERADVWWSSLLRTRFEDSAVEVAWDEFVRLFWAKFILEHIQDKMEQEFLTLTQGSMTVLEYEARFVELPKYAPHIVADELRKAKKFVVALKPSLRSRLVAFYHHTLDEALSAACR